MSLDSSFFFTEEKREDETIEWIPTELETYHSGPSFVRVDERVDDTVIERPEQQSFLETESKYTQKISGSYKVLEYENWLGRIVSVDSKHVIAKLRDTVHTFSPRMVEITYSYFESQGISESLDVGDEFELCFRKVQRGNRPAENEVRLRMIDTLLLSSEELKRAIDNDFESQK